MDKSVFLKSNDAVLYLVSGKKDALNLPILDSTTSEGAGEKTSSSCGVQRKKHYCEGWQCSASNVRGAQY